MGVKPVHPRKRAISKRPTTRRDWAKAKKGCKLRLGVIINKIEISKPKIILINCIVNPPNTTCNKMLEIADSSEIYTY